MEPPAVEAVQITKRYPGAVALREASFQARRGEIHGLCGENGAGKSTLIGILSGRLPFGSYEGELRINGARAAFRSTRDSHRAGVAAIHQELALVPMMSVEENIALGREPTRRGRIDRRRMRARALAQMERLRLDADPAAPVSRLGVGQRQMVEIAKALSRRAEILALDEPTSALTESEKETLFGALRELRSEGAALIYITHRLEELFELADRATVLRDGERVGEWRVEELTPEFLVEKMVGRRVAAAERPRLRSEKPPTLKVENWSAYDLAGRARLRSLSFEARPGEILGLAGMMGSGRTELLMCLYGAWEGCAEGRVLLDGEAARLRSPAEALRRGIALLTEDRKKDGLWLDFSLEANLTLPALRRFVRRGVLNRRARRESAEEMSRRLGVRAPSAAARVRNLSGGNQQKTAIGKALMTSPRVLLLDEPTRGVDVAAKAEIHALIKRLAEQGAAVIAASSDLPELLQLSHRMLALRGGEIAARFEDMRGVSAREVLSAAVGAAGEPI